MSVPEVETTLQSVLDGHGGPWTEQDYLAMPEDGQRIELLDGALLVNPPPTNVHQRLSGRLREVLNLALSKDLEALEGVGVRVGPTQILIPDVAVVRYVHEIVKAYDPTDVLLALEIVGPGSVAMDRAIKARLYAEAGIPTYVRVELAGPTATVCRLDGDRYVAGAPDPILRLTEPSPVELDAAATLAPR